MASPHHGREKQVARDARVNNCWRGDPVSWLSSQCSFGNLLAYVRATLRQANTTSVLPEQEVVSEGICCAWHPMVAMNHRHENPRSPVGSTGMAVWYWAGHFQDLQLPLKPSSWCGGEGGSEVSSHSWYEQKLLGIIDATLPQPVTSSGLHLGEDLIRLWAMAPFRGPGSFPVAASRRDEGRINPVPA